MAIKKKSLVPLISAFLAVALLAVGAYAAETSKTPDLSGRTAPNGEKYDLSVTTFNVGGFAAGVDTGITKGATGYGWSDALAWWDRDISTYTSDIYALQEFVPIFYKEKDANNNIIESSIIYSADKFKDVFTQFEKFDGKTYDDMDMYGVLATTSSGYEISNISGGHLSGKSSWQRRPWIRGEVEVNGKTVALYSMHLGFHDYDVNVNSYLELTNMLKKEDYFICMGDMNNDMNFIEAMKNAGFKVVNDRQFDTCLNGVGYIDNIILSDNIDLVYSESQATDENITRNKRGYSDHYPLTAYLSVSEDSVSAAQPVVEPELDDDGYVKAYY